MRKFFTILVCVLSISTSLLAQKKTEQKKFHIKLDYGAKTGINFSHLYLRDLQDNTDHRFNSKWRTGFVLGMFVKVPVYKQFSIQPEFLYSSMGGDYWTTPTTSSATQHVRVRYNYFSIPIMAKYTLNKHWGFLAGPQFDFLINGTERNSEGTFKVSDNLKDFDGLVTAGVEYWAGNSIVFMVRYMRGFNDIEYRANMVRFYSEAVQATMGIKFN
jgi:outer membrane protein with beta-barrel domain